MKDGSVQGEGTHPANRPLEASPPTPNCRYGWGAWRTGTEGVETLYDDRKEQTPTRLLRLRYHIVYPGMASLSTSRLESLAKVLDNVLADVEGASPATQFKGRVRGLLKRRVSSLSTTLSGDQDTGAAGSKKSTVQVS